ncbi:MAG: hypothetical protein WAT19_10770 [Ferruginibacter sp.]
MNLFRNILIVVVASLYCSCNSNSYELSDAKFDSALSYAKVKLAVLNISQVNRLDGKYVGFAGTTSSNYWNRVTITTASSNNELRALTRHPSPAVKACAFLELKERRYLNLKDILEENLGNKETFSFFPGGCVGSTEQINFFFLRELHDHLTNEEYQNFKLKMSRFYSKPEWNDIEKGIDFRIKEGY